MYIFLFRKPKPMKRYKNILKRPFGEVLHLYHIQYNLEARLSRMILILETIHQIINTNVKIN